MNRSRATERYSALPGDRSACARSLGAVVALLAAGFHGDVAAQSNDSEGIHCVVEPGATRTDALREQVRLSVQLIHWGFDPESTLWVEVRGEGGSQVTRLSAGARAVALAELSSLDLLERAALDSWVALRMPSEVERLVVFTDTTDPRGEPSGQTTVRFQDPPDFGATALQACRVATGDLSDLCELGSVDPSGRPQGDWDTAIVVGADAIRVFDANGEIAVAPGVARMAGAGSVVVARRPPSAAAELLGPMQVVDNGALRFAQCSEAMRGLGLPQSSLWIDGREVSGPVAGSESLLNARPLADGLHTVEVRPRQSGVASAARAAIGTVRARSAVAGSYLECRPGLLETSCLACAPAVSEALRADYSLEVTCLYVPWWSQPSEATHWVSFSGPFSELSRDCRGPLLPEPVVAMRLRADPMWFVFCGCIALAAVLGVLLLARPRRAFAVALQRRIPGGLREPPRTEWSVLPLEDDALRDSPLRVETGPIAALVSSRQLWIVEPLLPARRGVRAPLSPNVLLADGGDIYVLVDRRTARAIERGQLRPDTLDSRAWAEFRPNWTLSAGWRWFGRGFLAASLSSLSILLPIWVSSYEPWLTQRRPFAVVATCVLILCLLVWRFAKRWASDRLSPIVVRTGGVDR